MPKDFKGDSKHIPHHDGAYGNLPPIGVNAPGVHGGGKPTSKPNTTGGVFVPMKASGQSAGQASMPPQGNKYRGYGANFSH